MIGYWGELQFEVNSDWMQYPSNIERVAESRFQTYYPANSTDRPKQQFLGAELGTITFEMHLDQRFNSNIRDLLARIVTWVNNGYAQELVIGTKPYGFNKWVCIKAVEKFTDVLHNGVILHAIVEMTLKEI